MRRLAPCFAVCLLSVWCGFVMAQSYPARPIRLVTPWAAGASTEVVLRLLALRLGEKLGQPVLVENKPGGGTTLGANYVAKSAPDGYILLASYSAAIAPGPLMRRETPYDPLKDFDHIALVGIYPTFYVVNASSPVKTMQEFLALVKAKPGAINYASASLGSAGFLSAELLKQLTGLNMVHVAYKGPTPAINDLIGGRLDMAIAASAADVARTGKVRILAVTSDKRLPNYPDIPTVSEIVPGVTAAAWMGISAPARTPPAIATRLEREILAIIASADMQARLSEPGIGLTPSPLGSEKFVAFIENEIRFWTPVIKRGNIRVD